MSEVEKALVGANIHDGTRLHEGAALLAFRDGSAEIVARDTLAEGMPLHILDGGTIMPGFVDLQVNGGGGVMFNDDQSVATLRMIADAHVGMGTAALLPTLITDTPERTRAAIAAVGQAIADEVVGVIGIHLEGPHLSVARKGAHDARLIRPMTDGDMREILAAGERLPNVMVTVAPENCRMDQIRALSEAGVVVSLGHTDASYDTCMAAFDAGARCVTHLFNAMSQLGNREPGLVGAALSRGDVYAGLIADGIHVHPAAMRAAFAAKKGAARIFLVTDAMATAGSSITEFALNHRKVLRREGRLTLADGTLAGADLDMTRGISVLVNQLGHDVASAISRTTAIPAGILRQNDGYGRFCGRVDGLIHVDRGLERVKKIGEL